MVNVTKAERAVVAEKPRVALHNTGNVLCLRREASYSETTTTTNNNVQFMECHD